MPAYNFKKEFAEKVESGQKKQTIRRSDKNAKAGDIAYLYTGQRTKLCRKLGEGLIREVVQIEIGRSGCGEGYAVVFEKDGRTCRLCHDKLDELAMDDGFSCGEDMVKWFDSQYTLPFRGYMHKWDLKVS